MKKILAGMAMLATLLGAAPAHADDVMGQWLRQNGVKAKPAVTQQVERPAASQATTFEAPTLAPSVDLFGHWLEHTSGATVRDISAPAAHATTAGTGERGAGPRVVEAPSHRAGTSDLLQQWIDR